MWFSIFFEKAFVNRLSASTSASWASGLHVGRRNVFRVGWPVVTTSDLQPRHFAGAVPLFRLRVFRVNLRRRGVVDVRAERIFDGCQYSAATWRRCIGRERLCLRRGSRRTPQMRAGIRADDDNFRRVPCCKQIGELLLHAKRVDQGREGLQNVTRSRGALRGRL